MLRSLTVLTAVSALAWSASPVLGQQRGPNTISSEIVQSSTTLTANQQREVADFTRAQVASLSNGTPAQVVAARDNLIDVAKRPGVTSVFLRTYSGGILPAVTPILDGDESMRAENALRVVAFLRTPESTSLLVESIAPERQSDQTRRLVAAGLLALAVEDTPQSGLSAAALIATARGISSAIAVESDWRVVLEELRALGGIAANQKLTPQNQIQVRDLQFKAFATVGRRIEGASEPDPLAKAAYRAILGLRDELLDLAVIDGMDTGSASKNLRKMLVDIATGADRQWGGLQQDRSMMQAYEGTLRVGAYLLSLLGDQPDSDIDALAEAMTQALRAAPGSAAGDQAKSEFEAALARIG